MLTESFALPPSPLQVMLKVLSAVSALMVCEPDVVLFPDQPPDAVQLLANLLFQLIVVVPFTDTVVGLADIDSVGCFGPLTEMSTLSFILLPLYATAAELS